MTDDKPEAKRIEQLETRVAELEAKLAQLADELKRVDQRLTKARLDRWDVP